MRKIVFYIEEQVEDYCGMCQQLGPPEYGVKMHRSAPTQVFWVRAEVKGLPKNKRYTKLCSDCLFDAHSSDEVKAIYKNDLPWKPQKSGMFFIRSNLN